MPSEISHHVPYRHFFVTALGMVRCGGEEDGRGGGYRGVTLSHFLSAAGNYFGETFKFLREHRFC